MYFFYISLVRLWSQPHWLCCSLINRTGWYYSFSVDKAKVLKSTSCQTTVTSQLPAALIGCCMYSIYTHDFHCRHGLVLSQIPSHCTPLRVTSTPPSVVRITLTLCRFALLCCRLRNYCPLEGRGGGVIYFLKLTVRKTKSKWSGLWRDRWWLQWQVKT